MQSLAAKALRRRKAPYMVKTTTVSHMGLMFAMSEFIWQMHFHLPLFRFTLFHINYTQAQASVKTFFAN